MMANDVMDFPDPDSPTSPSTSPAAIENESPRTAAGKPCVGTDALICPAERSSAPARAEASEAKTARPERDCENSMVSSRTSSNGRTKTMVSAGRYFFGRDSGGTNPATR